MTTDLLGRGTGAILSECGQYRYLLWRTWEDSLPAMLWVMLNPSIADAQQDDPTLRKCRGFASRNGYGAIVIVNLFALRSPDPAALLGAADPIGPMNDHYLSEALTRRGARVVGGWGAEPIARLRALPVAKVVHEHGHVIHCFGRTASGAPRHPLMTPYVTPMEVL